METESTSTPDAADAQAPSDAQPPPAAQAPPATAYPIPGRGPHYKSPMFAGFLSMFPGLGNIYNGLYQRGITFFVIVVGIFATAVRHDDETLALLVPALGFSWLFNIFDAYRQATLMNSGYTEPAPPAQKQNTSGGLFLGVAVFLVGLYGLLREALDIDFAVILDSWYLGFLAFGGCG